MKLWLLRPKDLPHDKRISPDNPWNPWYDRCFGMVVVANTEQEARAIANVEVKWFYRRPGYGQEGAVWEDPELTTCTELKADNYYAGRVIIRDVHWA